ncbi:MAG: hypothetical protein L6R35_000385 [Caloplaca aegaea]|nr:MAG: hypothetical protein L6R35_000385 [Caloplaca aegaea]
MHRLRLALITLAACLPFQTLGLLHLHGRDLNAPLLDSYDYIVVGCGISGLVVTNRLTEDPSVSVLCIEAGDPDQYEPIIQTPVYVGADIGGIYDWLLSTTPQTQLDGAARPMPQGKVLGGGSILNAMCWNRGGQDDYNAWAALGNPGWDWEGMLPYFIKARGFFCHIAREYSINYNPLVHGFSGPVQVSYPRYFYPQSTNLFAALNYLGVPTQFDPNDGSSAGAAFVPTDLDPVNQTRSDARRAYFDPYVSRPNFHVITGQFVTRILIEGVGSNFEVSNPTPGGNEDGNGMNGMASNNGFGFGPGGTTPALDNTTDARLLRRQSPSTSNLRITGVEFAATASDARRTVSATREVIVAAGSLHSAQLLQLSGIGPSSLLDTYDIPIALDLPGVGNNLQDHCLVGTFYPYNNASYPSPTQLTTNASYNAMAEMEYRPWTAGSPNALAFNPLPLISNNSANILSGASDQDPTAYLPAGLDPTIVAGYTLQKQSLVRRLAETTVASYEIINNNAGSLTVAVMHPFSRGQCYIRSADPFEPPSIDPRWLTNPVDRQVLIEALLFNRQILATPAMLPLSPAQFVPTVDADEDAINAIINTGIRTEFHPSGTCAMLPLEQGGVVDPQLRVYGTQNLRVVDAGIFPMIPAAHLQAVVYAVAEKAADIIKADNVGVSTAAPSSYHVELIHGSDGDFQLVNSIFEDYLRVKLKCLLEPYLSLYIISLAFKQHRLYYFFRNSLGCSGLQSGDWHFKQRIRQQPAIVCRLADSVKQPSIWDDRQHIPVSNGDFHVVGWFHSNIHEKQHHRYDLVQSAQFIFAAELIPPTDFLQFAKLIFASFYVHFAIYSLVPATVNLLTAVDHLIHSTVQHSQASSPSEITPVVVSSLPSSLVQILSTLGIPNAVQTAPGVQITVTPPSTILNPTQLSSSVKNALTNGGVPTAAASALVPVIIGSFDTTLSVPSDLSPSVKAMLESAVMEKQRELQASIDAFIQWLLHFLHLA